MIGERVTRRGRSGRSRSSGRCAAMHRVQEADLVLYDALTDAGRAEGADPGPCFCVGKRAGRASVKQATINRLHDPRRAAGQAGRPLEGRRPVRVRSRRRRGAGARSGRHSVRGGAGRDHRGRGASAGRHSGYAPWRRVGLSGGGGARRRCARSHAGGGPARTASRWS